MATPKRTTIGLWIFIGVLLVALLSLFQNPGTSVDYHEITYSEFLHEAPRTRDVTIRGDTLTGHFTDNRAFSVAIPNDPILATRLARRGIAVTIGLPTEDDGWIALLVNILPMIVYVAVTIWPLLRIARALKALTAQLPARRAGV